MATVSELINEQVTRITGEVDEQTLLIEQLATALQGKGMESDDPVLQEKTATPSTQEQIITPDANYDGLSQVTVEAMPTAEQATPTISVDETGLITASAEQTAGYVEAGTSEATHQLDVQEAQTITPSTKNQVIALGKYLTGDQTVLGDENLIAENIKSGVTVFGVEGTCEVGGNGLPDFTYTGGYAPLDDGNPDWRIKFLSTGTLTLNETRTVDVFCVGGGGNGGEAYPLYKTGGGGGGGYTTTVKGIVLEEGKSYVVTVAAAAGASSLANADGTALCTASGGKNGGAGNTSPYSFGGDGGSGGGPGGHYSGPIGAAGEDGGDGGTTTYSTTTIMGGTGQGTTTREFGEETGDLYAGGGGGGSVQSQYNTDTVSGGAGGGGDGGTHTAAATAGEENTGGGGGGGSVDYRTPAAGGTGIVIIRNAR